jgi:SNF2 family DNA or RNA helicase
MSETEILALEAQEKALREQLASLAEKKREVQIADAESKALIEYEEQLKKEIEIVVTARQGGMLVCESLSRPDLLEVWKDTPGRGYRGYVDKWEYQARGEEAPGRNLIPIKAWEDCKTKLEALPSVSISWASGVEEDLDWYLTAPAWYVDVKTVKLSLCFEAKKGPNSSPWSTGFREIPGSEWDYAESWIIPLAEGWRIFPALEETEGVVYSETARTLILKQIEDRAKLDEIAGKEDSQDPRILKLDRMVWSKKLQKELPFHEYLLPFQRVGVEFMLVSGGRDILADDTGLGKTCQMIAYSEIIRMEDPKAQIVCSIKAGSIPNWIREIKNLTGEDAVVCVNTNGKKHDAIGKIMQGAPYIIISHDMMGTYEKSDNGDKEAEKNYNWTNMFTVLGIKVLLLDEAHQIRNLDTHRSKAHRKLIGIPYVIPATASPVINRTGEFWPLLNLIDPLTFASHQDFINTYTIDGRIPDNVEKLHEMLRPRFIRRRRGDVDKDMDDVNRITRISPMSDSAMVKYEEVLQGFYQKLAVFDPRGHGGEGSSVMHILTEILRLKQICAADKIPYTVELAQELIEESEGDKKVLIFSQFLGSAYGIAQALGHEAVCTVIKTDDDFVSMTPEERDTLFEATREDPKIKYVVTTEAAKETHNIEYCYWVIFNDQWWSPEAHKQGEGRAHYRMSNPHPIDAFYMLCDVKIEHWMQELLDQKFDIIEATVEGIELSRDVSGSLAMDLIKKIKEEMYQTN